MADRDLQARRTTAAVDLTAAIVAVSNESPRLLSIEAPDPAVGALERQDGHTARTLPFGPFDPEHDRTLDRGLRRWVGEQTEVDLGYVEQLYTFGDRWRDPREAAGAPRTLSVAYLALVRQVPEGDGARWERWYALLPWEDHRRGRPEVLDQQLLPGLDRWIATPGDDPERRARFERVAMQFGRGTLGWDPERALDRYQLLYEAGLVHEAHRDRSLAGQAARTDAPTIPQAAPVGRAMALDHRRIAATALGRLRGKLRYRPVVFELLPEEFTLLDLQRLVEALAGQRLHKQNFRRLVERGALVEGTGRHTAVGRGRPAELFRFRREVLLERPASGVGLP